MSQAWCAGKEAITDLLRLAEKFNEDGAIGAGTGQLGKEGIKEIGRLKPRLREDCWRSKMTTENFCRYIIRSSIHTIMI
jgi:hypothetical protein